jgi:nickel transport protein
MKSAGIILFLAAVTLTGGGTKHGIEVEISLNAPAVITRCTYSTEDPAEGVECVLFAPGSNEEKFQTGETDANGVFSFVPDAAGLWRLVVDDGQGHRKEVSVSVTEAFLNDESAPGTADLLRSGGDIAGSMPLWMKAVWGLSLIFGLAGILYLVQSRKTGKR